MSKVHKYRLSVISIIVNADVFIKYFNILWGKLICYIILFTLRYAYIKIQNCGKSACSLLNMNILSVNLIVIVFIRLLTKAVINNSTSLQNITIITVHIIFPG